MARKKKNALTEVKTEAAKMDATMEDHVVPAKDIEYKGGKFSIPGAGVLSMTDWGFATMCDVLGIPKGYLEKCAERGRLDMVATNVNGWLREDDRDLLVRTYQNVVEGVLTQRYIPFSHSSAIDAIESFMEDGGHDYSVHNWNCTPTSLFIRMTLNATQRELRVGDPFSGAMDVINSETGKFTFSVSPKLLRLACTNGMIVVDHSVSFERYRKVHLKEIELPAFHEYLERVVAQMPNGMNAVERVYNGSYDIQLDAAALWTIFSRVRGEVSRKFADTVFTSWMEEESFSVSLEKRVNEDDFYQGGSPTLAGFWNSATSVVQEFEDLDADKKEEAESCAAYLMFRMFHQVRGR